MEIKGKDITPVTSKENGLSFLSQKEWKRLPSSDLDSLESFQVIGNMVSTGSIYLLLRDMDPFSWKTCSSIIKLLKITTSEETGGIRLYTMDLNTDEAEYIRDHDIELWED